MKVDELWIIEYEMDASFDARLKLASDELIRSKELDVLKAELIYTSFGIHCGRRNELIPIESNTVKQYLKVSFCK